MDTLLLDRSAWDLALDANGNIGRATAPYSVVQDVASACRLFDRELYYGPPKGIRYFDEVLGEYQPIQVLKARLAAAALAVPGVLSAKVFLTSVGQRGMAGQVQIKTASGPAIVTL
jgi:hypothetical protein